MPQDDVNQTFKTDQFRVQNVVATDFKVVEFRGSDPSDLNWNPRRIWARTDTGELKYTVNGVDITGLADAAELAEKADQSDLDATNAVVATKANQSDLNATNAQVATNTTNISLNTANIAANTIAITNIGSATPKGTYPTLTALQTAFPTGTTGIYVVTADGNWYYWNGSAWTVGGVYQATTVANGSVTEIKTNFLVNTNLNLFNKNNVLVNSAISGSDHKTIIASPGNNVSAVYYPIENIKQYVGMNVSVVNVYDSAQNYLSTATSTFINPTVGSVLSILPNASNAFIRVQCTNSALNTAMVTEKVSDISSSDYFVYGSKETDFPYLSHTIDVANNIPKDSITYDKTDFIGEGKNLHDPATDTIGYFINTNTGVLAPNATYNTSDFRAVEAGKTYTISPRFRQFLLYNERKNSFTPTFINAATSNYTFTAAIDGYVRYSYFATDAATIQMEEGSSPTSYESYALKFTNDIQLTQNMINQANILAGKKIINFGDSIAAGDGNGGIGYAELIASTYGMTCYDKAIGGATVRVVSPSTNNILYQVNNATETDPDFVLFDGLTNDAYTTVTGDPSQLGSISTGYTASLNTGTFCGAFESMLKTAINKWLGKKVLYVCVHKMPSRDTGAQETLQSLARQICAKWSVPFIDLYNEGGLNTYVDAMRTTYADAGGTHPNELGYSTFFVPRIAEKMKML